MALTFLTNNDTAEVPTLFRYPGGEASVKLPTQDLAGTSQVAIVQGADSDNLVLLAMWANDIRRLGGHPIAFIPYLPGARADHADKAVGFDAAVYARLINAAQLDRVICVDPHSPVMPGLIERVEIIDAVDLIDTALPVDIRDRLVGLIIPDAGAVDRVELVAERLGLPTYQAYKHRDFATGQLSGFSCDPLPVDGDLLVVDDICDGGGTFRGLVAAIPEAAGRLHLWITHGVFSGRAAELAGDFKTITTTDSHPGSANVPGARVIPLHHTLLNHLTQGATR